MEQNIAVENKVKNN